MAISLLKDFKQKQKVSLTPSLKKSIDLLQLSRYELIQRIDQEIDVNPFIEKEEITDDLDFEEGGIRTNDFDFNIAASENLRESLINQIIDIKLNAQSKEIALVIIDCLDEAGKLDEELEGINELLSFGCSHKEIENILMNVIQNLEPVGVGYRNFKECIGIQINRKVLNQDIKFICQKILFQNESDDIEIIKSELLGLGYELKDIETSISEIKSCDLSPGLNYGDINYIVPDLKIRLEKNLLSVNFVTDNFPKIKIDSDLIQNTVSQLKKNPNISLSEKIQEAKWLISSVNKRNDTVLRVGELICKKQISFLAENPLKINPLSNKQLSEELELHPSTVSRILRSKYIDTPKGIISLKSLLASSVSKTRSVTPLQLMQLIEIAIRDEKAPKSDNKIAFDLNKRGFNLARRTISKYRKKLNIPSSRNR